MQIVVILRKILNTALSESMLQFSEHFQLIFNNSNVNNGKEVKQKLANFFLQTFQNYQIYLNHPSERSQKLLLLTATVWRFCYTPVRPYPWVVFHFFFLNFLKLIFATKIKTMLLKQSAVVYQLSKKKYILRKLCVWTPKILYANKWILT